MRSLVPIVILATLSTAHADPLSLGVQASGSTLKLAIRNTGAAAITLPTSSPNFDDRLTVTLTRNGQPARTLAFVEPSDKFIQRTTELAAGATYTETIDLVSWAFHGNADPPEPGDYGVTATWDNTKGLVGPKVRLSATTTLSIAAPAPGRCTSKPTSTGIELFARALDRKGTIEIGMHNASAASICVDERIVGSGIAQSDWLVIELSDAMGKKLGKLGFTASRKASALASVELPPGATTWTRWDLVEWAKLNGSKLPHGLVYAEAIYDGSSVTGAFTGKISAPFTLQLP